MAGDILLVAGDTAYLDLPDSQCDTYAQYDFWDWASHHCSEGTPVKRIQPFRNDRGSLTTSRIRIVASLQDAVPRTHPPTPHCAPASLVRGYWDFVPLARGAPKCTCKQYSSVIGPPQGCRIAAALQRATTQQRPATRQCASLP